MEQDEDIWTVPLLTSLLDLRADNWELAFGDEEDSLQDDEVDFMIVALSSVQKVLSDNTMFRHS